MTIDIDFGFLPTSQLWSEYCPNMLLLIGGSDSLKSRLRRAPLVDLKKNICLKKSEISNASIFIKNGSQKVENIIRSDFFSEKKQHVTPF